MLADIHGRVDVAREGPGHDVVSPHAFVPACRCDLLLSRMAVVTHHPQGRGGDAAWPPPNLQIVEIIGAPAGRS